MKNKQQNHEDGYDLKTQEYKNYLLIKYGENSVKIQKKGDKPMFIRTFNMKLTYESALNFLHDEYVLITDDYFFKKFKVSQAIDVSTNKLLMKTNENDTWEVPYKNVDSQLLIKKDEYLKIVYKLVESKKNLEISHSNQIAANQDGNSTKNVNRSDFTDVKYFKKKLNKRMKPISVSFLNAHSFHSVMQNKYDPQICGLTPCSLSYMLLFLIDVQYMFNNNLNNTHPPLVGILDDVKGVLAFSIKERLVNKKVQTKYFSRNAHKFTYDSKIRFAPAKNIQLTENFDIFFIASSINKVSIINSVSSGKFVIFISNITELQEVASFLFENINRFTDISVKELLNRAIEVKEYGNVFIHPEIKGRLGNGFIISFSPLSS